MKNRSITQLAALGVVLLLSAVYLGLGAGPAAAASPPESSRTPDTIDFGIQQVGTSSSPRTITVTSVLDGWKVVCDPTQRPRCWEQGVPTRISSLTIGGPNAAAFKVSSQNCTDRNLLEGQSCSINVTFTSPSDGSPSGLNAAGHYSATLNINSNSSWSTGNQVQLSGQVPPRNDNFAKALSITGAAYSSTATTKAATRETGEPDHYTSNPADADGWLGDHTVWYSWKALESGPTTIDTCQANIDSILAVYTGTALNSLSRVADNNNDFCGGGWGSKVTFNAQGGTIYRIAVGDAGGLRENTFTLKVSGPRIQAPTVTSTDPAEGALGVDPGANVTATFSEAMMPSSINGTTVKLFQAGTTTNAIGAAVSYDPTTNKATLDPNADLQLGTTYQAQVAGARDLGGNPLDQDPSLGGLQPKIWTFTITPGLGTESPTMPPRS